MPAPHRKKAVARKQHMQTRSGGAGGLLLFLIGVLLVVGTIVWTAARNSEVTAKPSPLGAIPRR